MTTYEIPNMLYDSSGEYFVHHRPLGEKIQGQYPHVPWSDIALQNVPLETTINLRNENEELEHMRRLEKMNEVVMKTMVGEKRVVKDVIECENNKNITARGEKPRHIKAMAPAYENKGRPIPKNTKKKFLTKPRIKEREQRSKYFKYAM